MIHRIGDIEIDTHKMAVRKSGVPIRLTARPYALLEYLMANRERIVTKEEIFDAVWDGRVVTDAAISTAVRDIRKAMGESSAKSGLIRTVYGRGFRFVVPDLREALATSGGNAQPLDAAQPSTVAVLPFQVHSSDPQIEHLANGFADDVISKVSKFGLIRMLSRNASFLLADARLSFSELSKQLGAGYILEGNVRQSGAKIRLSVQLVDARDEMHVWASSYDIAPYELNDSQDRTTTSVATSAITMIYETEAKHARLKEFGDLSPWECYCCAYESLCTMNSRLHSDAVTMLTRALEMEPKFAAAHATLAYVLCMNRQHEHHSAGPPVNGRMTQSRQRARELAQEAISIEPRLPFAWTALARCHAGMGEMNFALTACEKSLDLNPLLGWTHALKGMILFQLNRAEEALSAFDCALDTSPQDSLRLTITGGKSCALLLLNRFEEAIELSRMAQMLPNAGLLAFMGEIACLGHLGRLDEAADALKRLKVAEPDASILLYENDFPMPDPEARRVIFGGLQAAGA
ncbi:MAG: winged helix-turn-helix domain-containing protein [Pseudomonadota bacterium]